MTQNAVSYYPTTLARCYSTLLRISLPHETLRSHLVQHCCTLHSTHGPFNHSCSFKFFPFLPIALFIGLLDQISPLKNLLLVTFVSLLPVSSRSGSLSQFLDRKMMFRLLLFFCWQYGSGINEFRNLVFTFLWPLLRLLTCLSFHKISNFIIFYFLAVFTTIQIWIFLCNFSFVLTHMKLCAFLSFDNSRILILIFYSGRQWTFWLTLLTLRMSWRQTSWLLLKIPTHNPPFFLMVEEARTENTTSSSN